jgi:hypothetical protein
VRDFIHPHSAPEARLCSHSASYDQITNIGIGKASRRKIQKKVGMLGYGREEMDREKEQLEPGQGKRRRAVRRRRGGQGCFFCRGGGRGVVCGTCGAVAETRR